MLGNEYRFRVSNTQNQAITVTVKARYFKYASDGSLVWSAEQTPISAQSVAATTGTFAMATPVDNAIDKYIGAELTVEMTAAAATNGAGVLAVYLERSTDSGTTWPSQDQGQFVGGYTVTAANGTTAQRKNYLIR